MKNIIALVLALTILPAFTEHVYPENPDPTHAEFFGKLNRDSLVVTNGVDGAARHLPRYLWALDLDDAYPEDAAWYYRQADMGGACSSVRDGNTYSRNFDFPYDNRAEFVVRMVAGPDRLASVGVSNVGTNLTEEIVTSGKPSRFFKCLPGATVDGINECGVAANINVICTNGTERTAWQGHEINALGAVRWVLDHAQSAGWAASNLAAKVYIPDSLIRKGYSAHFMVVDERQTWIVEDGVAKDYTAKTKVLTNFRVFDMDTVDDPFGTGYERYDLLASGGNITSAWFRTAYRRPFTRPTEFAAPGIGTHTDTDALLAWADDNIPQGAPESLKRNGKSWQTIHTSVYDLSNRVLRVAVQEVSDWYTFSVHPAGGVKSVNGKTGDVVITADGVGAYTKDETDELVDEAVDGVSIDLQNRLASHNASSSAHSDKFAQYVSRNGSEWNDVKTAAQKSVQSDGEEWRNVTNAVSNVDPTKLKSADGIRWQEADGSVYELANDCYWFSSDGYRYNRVSGNEWWDVEGSIVYFICYTNAGGFVWQYGNQMTSGAMRRVAKSVSGTINDTHVDFGSFSADRHDVVGTNKVAQVAYTTDIEEPDYSTNNVELVGTVTNKALEVIDGRYRQFGDEFVYESLGFTDFTWECDRPGVVEAIGTTQPDHYDYGGSREWSLQFEMDGNWYWGYTYSDANVPQLVFDMYSERWDEESGEWIYDEVRVVGNRTSTGWRRQDPVDVFAHQSNLDRAMASFNVMSNTLYTGESKVLRTGEPNQFGTGWGYFRRPIGSDFRSWRIRVPNVSFTGIPGSSSDYISSFVDFNGTNYSHYAMRNPLSALSQYWKTGLKLRETEGTYGSDSVLGFKADLGVIRRDPSDETAGYYLNYKLQYLTDGTVTVSPVFGEGWHETSEWTNGTVRTMMRRPVDLPWATSPYQNLESMYGYNHSLAESVYIDPVAVVTTGSVVTLRFYLRDQIDKRNNNSNPDYSGGTTRYTANNVIRAIEFSVSVPTRSNLVDMTIPAGRVVTGDVANLFYDAARDESFRISVSNGCFYSEFYCSGDWRSIEDVR